MNTKEIAKQLKKDMGGNAQDICCGDCANFAKHLIKRVGKGEIVYTRDFELLDEIKNKDLTISESKKKGFDNGYSHCFVKIDGLFYDAFNTSGVRYESQMTFRTFRKKANGFF